MRYSNLHTGIGRCRQNVVIVVCFVLLPSYKLVIIGRAEGDGVLYCMRLCIQSPRRIPPRRRNADMNIAETEESQDGYQPDGSPRDERTN